ncbi:MAG: RNA polymerase sigma factor [Thermoanaerobaculia bacterium]|nr:RNA polymerase sigma factor [Thermoanaerobaculia bacterium]
MASPPADERELARRAAGGDVEAFERLFRAHQGRIYGLCLRMTGDVGRAEDLTQEAFLRAWRKLGSFRAESAFGSWLHRLTVNVVLSALRRRPARELRLADPEGAEAETVTPQPPDTARRLDLERAIAALPERARLVFLLHDVEGYRHREIAEAAGMAEGSSKAHLHRARRLLREALRR